MTLKNNIFNMYLRINTATIITDRYCVSVPQGSYILFTECYSNRERKYYLHNHIIYFNLYINNYLSATGIIR